MNSYTPRSPETDATLEGVRTESPQNAQAVEFGPRAPPQYASFQAQDPTSGLSPAAPRAALTPTVLNWAFAAAERSSPGFSTLGERPSLWERPGFGVNYEFTGPDVDVVFEVPAELVLTTPEYDREEAMRRASEELLLQTSPESIPTEAELGVLLELCNSIGPITDNWGLILPTIQFLYTVHTDRRNRGRPEGGERAPPPDGEETAPSSEGEPQTQSPSQSAIPTLERLLTACVDCGDDDDDADVEFVPAPLCEACRQELYGPPAEASE